MQEIEVGEERVQRAIAVLQDKKQSLSETAITAVLVELAQVYRNTSYDNQMNIVFNFTDLQVVAVAAAFAAAADSLGSPRRDGAKDRVG